MRRGLTRTIREHEPDALQPLPGSEPLLDIHLPLRTITPIIGGGTEPKLPDAADPVRVQPIRAHLRFWWRTLHADLKVDELHKAESRLFGAVDLDGTPRRGHVRVSIEILDRGRIESAGTQGKGQAVAWKLGDIGYAAFPLQRDESDRDAPRGEVRSPVEDYRTGVRFMLRVQIERHRDIQISQDLPGLTQAIRLWTSFGGIGSRTRRGFGALAIDGEATPAVEEYGWRKASTLTDWACTLRKGEVSSGGEHNPWPAFDGLTALVVGDAKSTAEDALRYLIGRFKEFRQGRDFARGREWKPSFWPEADSMRLLRERHGGPTAVRFEHPPDPQTWPASAEFPAPRAAFGMPLLIRFKKRDRGDSQANGEIVPVGHARLPSPVILRPVAIGNRFHPCVLVFGNVVPKQVTARINPEALATTIWRRPDRNRPVADLVATADGNAVAAFVNWYRKQQAAGCPSFG